MSAVVGCADEQESGIPDLGPPAPHGPAALGADLNPRLLRRFRPLQRPTGVDEDIVALGKMLFFDPRLSRDHDLSCNSCHRVDRDGADGRAISVGHAGRKGKRNAPTVFNTNDHVALFWDGRAASLEQQASSPILNPDEMAMTDAKSVAQTLQKIPGYATAFEAAFPGEPIDLVHVGRAIAAFERTLVTPSRWDRFLEGERSALTSLEQRGLKLFADVGCVQCHTGELVGGSMFQKVGITDPWPNQTDQGRFELTHLDTDKMVFKVPSLRNVQTTGPYFHDGSVATLRTAIAMMAKHQLGTELSPDEVTSIEAWLKCLSSDHPAIAPPSLP